MDTDTGLMINTKPGFDTDTTIDINIDHLARIDGLLIEYQRIWNLAMVDLQM